MIWKNLRVDQKIGPTFGTLILQSKRCLAGEVRNVQGIRVARNGTRYDVFPTLSLRDDERGVDV